MINTPPPMAPPQQAVAAPTTWKCGTLTYTKAGIVALFVFLLWGNFAFTLMMQVVPSILPLKLKSLGASDWLIGMLISSIFPFFGMLISPYLSFKSDYLRTRWGRRLPFFFVSLPLVTASILLLAFSQDIAGLMQRNGLLASLSPGAAAIAVMAVCIVAFQFSDVVVCSIYNYIFKDTVPMALIGRFVGLMQVVGGAVGFIYNYFIFKYAETHMREIFVGTAVVYFLGIGMMCLFVKEGEYPPVTEKELRNSRGAAGLGTFFRESFSHKFYWTKFAYAMSGSLAAVMWPFNVFFYKEMGLTLDYIGKAAAITSIAGIVGAYFASVYVDRWHPLRILTYSAVFAATLSFGGWVWLFVTLPPKAFFWLNMLGVGLIGVFHNALNRDASMPFDMRLLPKSRYGQFCSAQSIVANVCKMLAGVAAGLFFGLLKDWFFPGRDFVYRFSFLWTAGVNIAMAFVICSLYRQWKALGGDQGFNPPAPWSDAGQEAIERTPFVGVQTQWLRRSLLMIRALMLATPVYLSAVAAWLWLHGGAHEAKVFAAILIPAGLGLAMLWSRDERALIADLGRCAEGLEPRDGIPHHGVMFVKALVLLVSFPVSMAMLVVAVINELPVAEIVFGAAVLVTNAMVIVAIRVLRRIERGFDPMLEHDGFRKTEA